VSASATIFERDEQGEILKTRRRERRQLVGALGKTYVRDVEVTRTIRRDPAGDIAAIDEEVAPVGDDASELQRWAAMFQPDPRAAGSYRGGG
jgi:hypothetical protein